MALNIADLFEHAVDAVDDHRVAIVFGNRRVTYRFLEDASNKLAHYFSAIGVEPATHVAIYAQNSIEHVVAMLAAFKLRAVPINVNYRYVAEELDYLLSNSTPHVVVMDRQYASVLAAIMNKHPHIKNVLVIDDRSASPLDGLPATLWDEALSKYSAERDFAQRQPDDIYMVYTGGTTGYPKGVMWRHEDVWRTLGSGIDYVTGRWLEEYDQSQRAATEQVVSLPVGPLMHGGGQWAVLGRLFVGHTVVMTAKFDPHEIWRLIDREHAQYLFFLGDAMARPLIEAYDEGNYDGSSILSIASSAAVFSPSLKKQYLDRFPNAFVTDAMGSSETGFSGMGLVDNNTAGDLSTTMRLGPETVLLDDDNNVMDPASTIGQTGRVARSGSIPLGYYKDPVKTAETFINIDNIRWSVPGDLAEMLPEAKVKLLGRGSNCINTGGEKVFPEEVEKAIKAHTDVYDALVVGMPDERFGQHVAVLVQGRSGAQPTLDELRDFLRHRLAGYKLPRSVAYVDQMPRHATGKANYPRAQELLTQSISPPITATDDKAPH